MLAERLIQYVWKIGVPQQNTTGKNNNNKALLQLPQDYLKCSGYIFTNRRKYVSVSSNKKEIVAVLKEQSGIKA